MNVLPTTVAPTRSPVADRPLPLAWITQPVTVVPAELSRTMPVPVKFRTRGETDDRVALVGPRDIDGLVIATGHHRSGILLAPVTAEIVRDLALKGETRWAAQTWAPR